MIPDYTLEQVLKVVCDYYNVSKQDVISEKKPKKIAKARQIYFYLGYELTKNSHAKVAEYINRLHPCTIYSHNKTAIEMQIYKHRKKEVEEITVKLIGNIPFIPIDVNLLYITQNYF